jgi:hypothetical protein
VANRLQRKSTVNVTGTTATAILDTYVRGDKKSFGITTSPHGPAYTVVVWPRTIWMVR